MASLQPIISSIPAEIRLYILERCADVSTAANLAQSSKSFHTTWQCFGVRIAEKILMRTIGCYDDARSLVEKQNPEGELGLPAYVSRILTNAKTVEKQFEEFKAQIKLIVNDPYNTEEDNYPCDWPMMDTGEPFVSSTEHTRFIHAHYLIQTLYVIIQRFDDPKPELISLIIKPYLDILTARDMYIIHQVSALAHIWCHDLSWRILEIISFVSDLRGFEERFSSSSLEWSLGLQVLRDDYQYLFDHFQD
ncbi:MAG: hypothetical protein Q9209_000837 [Squamulea sp. 1 TL-2023]